MSKYRIYSVMVFSHRPSSRYCYYGNCAAWKHCGTNFRTFDFKNFGEFL